MAPVNPEGQTAQAFGAAALICDKRANGHPEGSAAALEARKCANMIRSEFGQRKALAEVGQTAQEVREWRVLIALRHGCPIEALYGDDGELQCNACRVDFARQSPEEIRAQWARNNARALASTPSPIQTQSTKEQTNGAGRIHEGGSEGHGGSGQGGVRRAAEGEKDGLHRAHERHLPVLDGSGERRPGRDAEEEVAPSPAKQTEQKIASAEGAASQSGAAPAPLDLLRIGGHCTLPPGLSIAEALGVAPAQPDARDAEIARLKEEATTAQIAANDALADVRRLTKERDFEREQRDLRHAAYIEERDKAARLTKELEEARAALQATNKHAATVAHERDYLMQVDLPAATERADAAEAQAKALREALKTARENLVHAAIQFASHYGEEDNTQRMRGAIAVLDHALAPTEPKAEAEPMVFCGAGEPGHDGEHRRTPRCWYPHKAGEPSPADWVNIPRAAPPPAETAGQKEGP